MKKEIVIPYFPKGLKFATPAIIGGGVWLAATAHPVWGGLCLLLSTIILTTDYVTEIDMDKKRYSDYLSLLNIRFNEEHSRFNHVEKIVITKGSYAQNIQTRVQSRQLNWSDYTGTLIMDNDRTLDLLTRHDKAELIKGLKPFADFLKVDVEDCTTPQPYWIDLSKVV